MVAVRLVWNSGQIEDEFLPGNYRPLYVYKHGYDLKVQLESPETLEELNEIKFHTFQFIYQGESLGKHVYIEVIEKEDN